MHENNRDIQIQRSLKHATFQQIIINVIMKYENNAETVLIGTIERFTFTQHHRLRHRHMTFVMSSCSPIPGSFHKPEYTQCRASCTCVAGCCSLSRSLPFLDLPVHTYTVIIGCSWRWWYGLWIHVRCTWCDLLPEPLMPEGVHGVSQSSIVEYHQCRLSCICHIVRWSWMCRSMQHRRLLRTALFVWYFLREGPFPIPWRRDVVSHPRTACRKRMCWHMSGPSRCFTALMFHMWDWFFLRSPLVQDKRRGRAILSLRAGSKREAECMCHHLQAHYYSTWQTARPPVQHGGQHLPEHGASDSSSSLTIHFAWKWTAACLTG